MDSASQCSAKQFNVGTSPITIYGKGAVQSNPGSLTECQITLISEKTGEVRRFRVEIKQATINEQNVAFTMYDGQSTGSNRLVRNCIVSIKLGGRRGPDPEILGLKTRNHEVLNLNKFKS